MRAALIAATVFSCAACDKKPSASQPPGPSQTRLAQASEALEKAGFKTDALKPADPGKFSAQKCTEGALDGVETLLCEYGSADAVALGKKAGNEWLAQAPTGAVLENGFTVLAAADRARADPNGKTIHRITQAFIKAR